MPGLRRSAMHRGGCVVYLQIDRFTYPRRRSQCVTARETEVIPESRIGIEPSR
jgi:hypothetical protein